MLRIAENIFPMMHLINTIFLLFSALVLVIPCLVFLVECIAAFNSSKPKHYSAEGDSPKTTVLVPAHNEAAQIRSVLETVMGQLTKRDNLVVIADNCEDNTAAIARETGATVIERFNLDKRGKGYALDYGLKYIQNDAPEVVVILDADCIVEPGTIELITRLAYDSGRPVQSTYLMEQPDNPGLKDNISAFSIKVKNLVRLQGLNKLGWHCLLTGSGMAFPWSVIRQVSLAGSKTTDDMQLTVDLAIAGSTPVYCPQTRVIGRLMKNQAAQSQRARWEHGHLEMILVEVPRLIKESIRQRRFDLLGLALDICIPPLSLLVMVTFAAAIISWLSIPLGVSSLVAITATVAECFLITALLTAWFKFGRSDLPFSNLIAIPFYILSKIPIYLKFIVQPQSRWLQTERDILENSKVNS